MFLRKKFSEEPRSVAIVRLVPFVFSPAKPLMLLRRDMANPTLPQRVKFQLEPAVGWAWWFDWITSKTSKTLGKTSTTLAKRTVNPRNTPVA